MMIWRRFRRRSQQSGGDVKSSLRRRYVFGTGAVAIALLVVVSGIGSIALARSMRQQQDAVLIDAARRSALLVDRVLAERLRQVDLIAWESSVIEAARKGTAVSRRRGLPFQREQHQYLPSPALKERGEALRAG